MSKATSKEDPFELAGMNADDFEEAARSYSEAVTTLKRLRMRGQALVTARANDAIASKADASRAVDDELSKLQGEERRALRDLSSASMRYRQLLDKLKRRDVPLPFPLPHQSEPRMRALRYLCPPERVRPVHLLAYRGPFAICVATTAPAVEEIQGGETPPEVHIYISGGDPDRSCGAWGSITWGFDIQADHVCKLEIGGLLKVCGIAYFPDTDGPTSYEVVLEGNILIAQYRACGLSVTEIDTSTTPTYRIWRAHPPASFEAGNPHQTVTAADGPGFLSLAPHEAEIFEEVQDVKNGDAFVFYYSYSVFVHHGVVDCGMPVDDGHLVIYPPYAVQHVYREPRRLLGTHVRPWG